MGTWATLPLEKLYAECADHTKEWNKHVRAAKPNAGKLHAFESYEISLRPTDVYSYPKEHIKTYIQRLVKDVLEKFNDSKFSDEFPAALSVDFCLHNLETLRLRIILTVFDS